MKLIKRILISAGLLLAMGLIGLWVLGTYFEEDILAEVSSAINEVVDTEIEVERIDFSLLADFPMASVQFSKVRIHDMLTPDSFLLSADQVSLQFPIWSMIRGDYSIHSSSIDHGELRMYVNEQGLSNYIFWKESEEDGDLEFAIEELVLTAVDFRYDDMQGEVSIHSIVDKGKLSMELGSDEQSLYADLDGDKTSLWVSGVNYIQDQDVDVETSLIISDQGDKVNIQEGLLNISGNEIPLNGLLTHGEHWTIELYSQAKVDVRSLLTALPQEMVGGLFELDPQGNFGYQLVVQGQLAEGLYPSVEVDYDWQGAMRLTKGGTPLRQVKTQGRYSLDDKAISTVDVAHLSGALPQGKVSFQGRIRDFAHPHVHGSFQASAEVVDVLPLLDQEVIRDPSGEIDVDLKINGPLPVNGLKAGSVDKMGLFGTAHLTHVGFTVVSNGYQIREVTSELILKDGAVILEGADIKVNQDALHLQARLDDVWAYALTDDREMMVTAQIQADKLRWTEMSDSRSGDTHEGAASLPERIRLKADFDIGEWTGGAFVATALRGSVRMNEHQLDVGPLSFQSCGGSFHGEIALTQLKDSSWNLRSEGSMLDVDIPSLFKATDDFGQEFLLSSQIKGNGNVRLKFNAQLTPDLKIDTRSIDATAGVVIEDGELIEHPSMVDMVAQLRSRHLLKPFVRADELEKELHHLRFARLENEIRIHDGWIRIPSMTIANNAMDIGLKGTHSFENEIDYNIEFTLRDILVNKRNPEFLIQDDGLGHRIHLSMYGTTMDPIVALDKQAVKENRKEAIAEAKEDIKEFFSNPFKKKQDQEDTRSAVHIEVEQDKVNASVEEEKDHDEKKSTTEKKSWWKIQKGDEPEEVEVELPEEEDF